MRACLTEHAKEWRKYFDDLGVFLDWCCIYQKDPALFNTCETPEAKPEGAERDAFIEDLNQGRTRLQWYTCLCALDEPVEGNKSHITRRCEIEGFLGTRAACIYYSVTAERAPY